MGCCSSTATQVQQLSPQSQPKKSDVETKLPIKSAFREERQPNFADDNQLKAVKKSNDVVVNHMNALNHCHSLIDRCGEYMKILNILSRISPSIPFDPVCVYSFIYIFFRLGETFLKLAYIRYVLMKLRTAAYL